jgi:hypothetical protein
LLGLGRGRAGIREGIVLGEEEGNDMAKVRIRRGDWGRV